MLPPMSTEDLMNMFQRNKKLTASSVMMYLILLALCDTKPYRLEGYIATKINSKRLEEKYLIKNPSSQVKRLKQANLIQVPKEHIGVFVLGERKTVETNFGTKTTSVYYFEEPQVLETKKLTHKEVKEKDETIKKNIEKSELEKDVIDVTDFYAAFYRFKLRKQPTWEIFRDKATLRHLFGLGFSVNVLKTCVIIYLNLDDEYIRERDYPLSLMQYRIKECQSRIAKNMEKYGTITEEMYCEKLVLEMTDKYELEKYKDKNILKNMDNDKQQP